MTKLLILDKDGTLVRPKSGGEFVQHPEDQELLPGVADAIGRYAAEGWTMAIASNQGGCAWRQTTVSALQDGVYVELGETEYYCSRSNVASTDKAKRCILLHKDGCPAKVVSIDPGALVRFRYKTEAGAIAEMLFCLKLLPQTIAFRAYFCPDMEGNTCYAGDWRGFESMGWLLPNLAQQYRKPHPGMIHLAMHESYLKWDKQKESVLLVGDRPEDQGAAAAAEVSFMWAHEWRGDHA